MTELPAQGPTSGELARGARTTMRELGDTLDVFETFFDSACIGLALADLAGRYFRVNPTYARLLGRSPEDLIGVSLGEVFNNQADGIRAEFGAGPMQLPSAQNPALQDVAAHLHPDGRVTWLLHGVTTVIGTDGQPGWYAVSAQDITERRNAEQELRALTDVLADRVLRDPLTGLANRVLLEERLSLALSRDARTGGSTAVIFLDLDGFKEVNDQYGHAAGDEVLRGVAERLTTAVRPFDTVARVGGDEFVVLVEQATAQALEVLPGRVGDAVCRPMVLLGHTVTVGASLGVAVSRAGDTDAEWLLNQADARMYDAKRALY